MNPSLSTATIKKYMFRYLAAGSLILSIAISIGTITPVYSRLKNAEDAGLLSFHA